MSFSKDSAIHTLLSMTPAVGTIATAAYGAKRDKDMAKLKDDVSSTRKRALAKGRAQKYAELPGIERSRLLGTSAIGDSPQTY